jgi:hypothetical protein
LELVLWVAVVVVVVVVDDVRNEMTGRLAPQNKSVTTATRVAPNTIATKVRRGTSRDQKIPRGIIVQDVWAVRLSLGK